MKMALREVKLCLLGDSGVGKSSIVLRFVCDQYRESLESTIGASFMTKRLTVNNMTYHFQIWDTAGQEKYHCLTPMYYRSAMAVIILFDVTKKYRALAPMYYRGAAAAIIVYDVTREASFAAVKDWIMELRKNATMNMVIAIAGNKCDLADLREVSTKEAQDYADEINAIFAETSAMTAVNVQEIFELIAARLPAEDLYRPQSATPTVRATNTNVAKKGGCCSRS